MYPNTPHYVGTGSTDAEANFVCEVRPSDDPDLLSGDADLLRGNGPSPNDFDIDQARLMSPSGLRAE